VGKTLTHDGQEFEAVHVGYPKIGNDHVRERLFEELVVLSPHSRVYLHSLHAYGEVAKIHMDTSAVPIYTIRLDDRTLTPDGLYDARAVELLHLV